VAFDIDANGLLEVSATDRTTGRKQKVSISGGSNLNEQEIKSIIEEAKSKANEDRKKRSVIDRKNSALTLIAQAERRLRDASLEFGPYGAERQQRAVEIAIQDVEEYLDDYDPQELEISVSALQEALFGLNRKFAAERKTDNNPLQGIKNTFGSLKDELFSDDYWDDDPWDNQMNRNYRNSRYGNSRDDDPWDNDYFLKDYLSILGLSNDFDDKELKKAFRREARKWHPDLNKNDLNAEERFKLINEAYEYLRDPNKRNKNSDVNIQEDYENNNFKTGFPDFQDYLDSLFGYEYNANNEDEYTDEPLDDESTNLENDEFNNYEYPTTSPEEPPPVKLHQDIETIIELTPNEALNGASILIELEDQTMVEVDTPPFAGDGWRLRLENIARGGKDHYLQLKVQTESGLRIDGLRVIYKLELFPHDALLGCAVEVPTLDGNVTLQVPPKSSTGRMLRLKGRGLAFEDNVGDQYVEILVVIPADINDEEIALYTRLQELSLSDS